MSEAMWSDMKVRPLNRDAHGIPRLRSIAGIRPGRISVARNVETPMESYEI